MKIKGWFLIFGLVVVVLFSLPIWTANNASDTSDPACERSIITSKLSPGRAYIAQQTTQSCENKELGASIIHKVTIINLQSHKTYDVLVTDQDGRNEDRLAMSWITSNILEVTISDRPVIKVFTQNVPGLHVQLIRRSPSSE